MEIDKVISVEVPHTLQAYSVLFVSKSLGNIVYSGDTMPNQNLFNYTQGAKLLIHEATL